MSSHKRQYSQDVKELVVHLRHEIGVKSSAEIAKLLKMSERVVQRVLREYKLFGKVLSNKKRAKKRKKMMRGTVKVRTLSLPAGVVCPYN